jgi:hypothetical protein
MRARLMIGMVFVACSLAIACDAPNQAVTAPSAQASTPPPSIASLAGGYTFTVNLSCTDLPEAERQRTYQATLERTNFSYLTVRLLGEGYDTLTVVGDMWPQGNGDVLLRVNNFDFGGCDGNLEVLPDGTKMLFCGEGLGTPAEPTIRGSMPAKVVVGEAGTRPVSCPGPSSFEFRRFP